MNYLISVIISTYNRYEQLCNAINSVLNQTYSNIEIVVVNDYSSDNRYKSLINLYNDKINSNKNDMKNNVKNNNDIKNVNKRDFIVINLDKNSCSRNKLGFPSCGYVRNQGFKIAKGDYIAIIDDDDYWLPDKLEKQMNIMIDNNITRDKYLACCTEAFISDVKPDSKLLTKNSTNQIKLKKYNSEYYYNALTNKYGFDFNNISNEITKKEINHHNIIICSSVLFNKKVFELIGYMPEVENWRGTNGIYQDWEYWKKICNIINTNNKIYYLKIPLLIYYKNKL